MKRLDLIIDALEDMLSGWKYIRESHGDLYGVGWDRAESKAVEALAVARKLRELEPVAWLDEEFGLAYTSEELADVDATCFEPLYALGDEK